jgi:glycosyl hydrolase family 43/flagellar hook capping protein FlgD
MNPCRASSLAAVVLCGLVAPAHATRMVAPYPYQAKEFAVIHHQGLFHLFYMRRDLAASSDRWWSDLGHATSSNLKVWTQHAPILPIRPLNWDSHGIWAPHVIQRGAIFYMFYTAVTDQPGSFEYHQRIGLATSTDLFNWTRLDTPIYECADASWTFCDPVDPAGGDFRDAFVMPDPETPGQYLLYHVARAAGDHNQLLAGVARSNGDLTQWTPIAPLMSTHRLKTGSPITESPHLLQHNGTWFLFYTTWNLAPIGFQTCSNPLADSASWGPHSTLDSEVPGGDTNDWFGSEALSVAGRDYLAAVNSDGYAIEFRELVWSTGNHFSFGGQPLGVEEPGSGWLLRCSPSRPGWDRLPIRIEAPRAAEVRLEVLDAAGRVRRTLLAGSVPAGATTLTWDGTDEHGRAAASGMYFVALRTPEGRLSRRVPRLR